MAEENQLWKRIQKWIRYARQHPLQAVGLLIAGTIPVVFLHLIERRVEIWGDALLEKHGDSLAASCAIVLLDFVARHPAWSIAIFALALILGLLIHAYFATHPYFEFEKQTGEIPPPTSPPIEELHDPAKEAITLSDALRAFLKECGPRPDPKRWPDETDIEFNRRRSSEIGPWIQRLVNGWAKRFADRAKNTLHLLGEHNVIDFDLDRALASPKDENNILLIADKFLLLSARVKAKELNSKPNLSLGCGMAQVAYDPNSGVWTEHLKTDSHPSTAFLLHITNTPPGAGVSGVRAQIEWTYDTGIPGPSFCPAMWLNEPYGKVDLPVGWRRTLLVGIKTALGYEACGWTGYDNRRIDVSEQPNSHSEIVPQRGTLLVRVINDSGEVLFESRLEWKVDLRTFLPDIKLLPLS